MSSNIFSLDFSKEYLKIKPFTIALFQANGTSLGNGVLIKYDKQPMIVTNYQIIEKNTIISAGSEFLRSINIKLDDAALKFKLGKISKGCGYIALIEILTLTI